MRQPNPREVSEANKPFGRSSRSGRAIRAKFAKRTSHSGEVREADEPFGRSSRSEQAIRAKFAKRTSHSGEVREADEPCGIPPPLGRAEQRSSVRIKTLALFERSEFASVPNAASSARNPKGTDVARLFFGYFFLAKQKKVTRPPGRDPACHRSTTKPAQQTPSLRTPGQPQGLPLRPHCSQGHGTPCPYDLTPHSYDLTPHSSLLTPHSSLLRPHSSPSPLTPHNPPCFFSTTKL